MSEPSYTPTKEFLCDNSTTHYQGCKCHEARHAEEIAKLRFELKLAIEHDRQPYPTAEAYELVCKRRDSLQAQLTRSEEARRRLRQYLKECVESVDWGQQLGEEMIRKKIKSKLAKNAHRWQTMAGDTPLEQMVNAYLTCMFAVSKNVPVEECLIEAKHIIAVVWAYGDSADTGAAWDVLGREEFPE